MSEGKLQASATGKIIAVSSTGKPYASSSTSAACCCCSCDTCDGTSLIEGVFPQFYTVSHTGVLICASNVNICRQITTYNNPLRYMKLASLTATVNDTGRLCMHQHYAANLATHTPATALYHCKLPASRYMNYTEFTNSGCTTAATKDLQVSMNTRINYFGAEQTSFVTKTITTAVRTSNVITFTTSTAHAFAPGHGIVVTGVATGAGGTNFNGTFAVIATPTTTTLTVAQTAINDTSSGGQLTGPHTMAVTSRISILAPGEFETLAENGLATLDWTNQYTSSFPLFFHNSSGVVPGTPTMASFTRPNQTVCAAETFASGGSRTYTPCNLL